MDCLTLRILLQNVCSYKCRFCSKVCASSRLVSQVHMIPGQNIKKKYLMCQIPIKMLTQHAIQDSSLHNLKIYWSKGCVKTSQSLKMNYITIHVAKPNTAILNIRIFSRRDHFRLWVFVSTGEYFYYWHWRVLTNVLQSKWMRSQDSRPFLKALYIILCSLC